MASQEAVRMKLAILKVLAHCPSCLWGICTSEEHRWLKVAAEVDAAQINEYRDAAMERGVWREWR